MWTEKKVIGLNDFLNDHFKQQYKLLEKQNFKFKVSIFTIFFVLGLGFF